MPVVTTGTIRATLSYRHQIGDDGHANITVPRGIPQGGLKFKRKGGGEFLFPASHPMDFLTINNFDNEEFYSRFVRNHEDPEINALNLPDGLIYEAHRVWNALTAWELTPGRKMRTKEDLFRRSYFEGPSFSEIISDEWDYGIRRSFLVAGCMMDYSEWKRVEHYNALPPVSALFHWKESSNDIEYMQIPCQPFDQELLKEFRSTLEDLMPDELDLPTDMEILSEVKTSTSFDPDKMKSTPFYLARCGPLGSTFSRCFKAKRSIIRIGPTNTRDSVVTSIDTYNSVKKCDLIILRVLDELEESLVNSVPSITNRRLRKASTLQPECFYWLRDIKKCGLTLPRELIHIVQEVLSETYPDKDFQCFDIFRYFNIYNEDGELLKNVHRGYSLGMANNCVTLIQCVIYRMFLRRMPHHFEIEGYFGNDDSILCCKNGEEKKLESDDLLLIQEEDFKILMGLNIITNDKKSFWSRFPIIFERYGHHRFEKKESRVACALSAAYLAPDIRYAKLLVSTLSQSFWDDGEWVGTMLSDIVRHFGFEYFPDEVNYDYLLGGWVSGKRAFISTALIEIETMPEELISRAFLSVIDKICLNKALIKSFSSDQVTKNYSVSGSRLGITHIDFDRCEGYNISLLHQLIMGEKEFKDFYSSVYRMSRDPYAFFKMRENLFRREKKKYQTSPERWDLMHFVIGNIEENFCIPNSLVLSHTNIFEYDRSINPSLSPYIRRNSLSRYLQMLKENSLILSKDDIHKLSSSDYEVTSLFKDPSAWSKDQVECIVDMNGNIPDGVYQFGSNPWLILNEYVARESNYPCLIKRMRKDRPNFDLEVLKRDFKSELEFVLFFDIIKEKKDFEPIQKLLDIYEDLRKERPEPLLDKTSRDFKDLCEYHQMGEPTWDATFDVHVVKSMTCELCHLEHRIWSMRFASDHDSREDYRLACRQALPSARFHIEDLIKSKYKHLEHMVNVSTQVRTSIFDEEGDEGMSFDLLGMLDS